MKCETRRYVRWDWEKTGRVRRVYDGRVPAEMICSLLRYMCVPQFMNCVYPSAPVTITSIQILMASAEGATM